MAPTTTPHSMGARSDRPVRGLGVGARGIGGSVTCLARGLLGDGCVGRHGGLVAGGDAVGQAGGVVVDEAEQGRPAGVLPGQAQEVQPGTSLTPRRWTTWPS